MTANIYDLPTPLEDEEQFTRLIPDRGVLIERIVSTGQALNLRAGDPLLIPARKRHRVEHTSADPPCIRIAVHGKLTYD